MTRCRFVEGMALALLWLIFLNGVGAAQQPDSRRSSGEGAFDAAPFGTLVSRPGANEYVLRWAEPRKIRRVLVEFGSGSAVPAPDKIRLQYWHRTWDGRPDPVLEEAGAPSPATA